MSGFFARYDLNSAIRNLNQSVTSVTNRTISTVFIAKRNPHDSLATTLRLVSLNSFSGLALNPIPHFFGVATFCEWHISLVVSLR